MRRGHFQAHCCSKSCVYVAYDLLNEIPQLSISLYRVLVSREQANELSGSPLHPPQITTPSQVALREQPVLTDLLQ